MGIFDIFRSGADEPRANKQNEYDEYMENERRREAARRSEAQLNDGQKLFRFVHQDGMVISARNDYQRENGVKVAYTDFQFSYGQHYTKFLARIDARGWEWKRCVLILAAHVSQRDIWKVCLVNLDLRQRADNPANKDGAVKEGRIDLSSGVQRLNAELDRYILQNFGM